MEKRMGADRRSALIAASIVIPSAGAVASALASSGESAENARGAIPDPLRDVVPTTHQRFLAIDSLASDAAPRTQALRTLVAVLGREQHAGFALGASLFTPAPSCPRQLKTMPLFVGDVLDPAYTRGDVLLQIGGRIMT